MIQRLIQMAQAARTRPPGPVSAIAGAVAVGLGLTLIHRYHGHLLEQVDALEERAIAKTRELDHLMAQVDSEEERARALLRPPYRIHDPSSDGTQPDQADDRERADDPSRP